jgi:hypothetical protein
MLPKPLTSLITDLLCQTQERLDQKSHGIVNPNQLQDDHCHP